jgi:uncharacterized protein
MEKINVKNVVLGDVGTNDKVNLEERPDEVELAEDIKVKNIDGKLKITRLEETILVTGEFVAETELTCDRCLETFDKGIGFNLDREYEINRTTASEEGLYVDKYLNIDITEPVREELIMAIPMKKICQEICKGICSDCGKNLNDKECNCEKE